MIKFLKSRAALIGVMFGLFGGGLSQLLVVDEMTKYFNALASLLALLISLMVSFLLQGKWNRGLRNKIKAISIALFIGFIAAISFHTMNFTDCTFLYTDFDGNSSYYIKGNIYTTEALKFKKENKHINSDEQLVREGFISPEYKDQVWTPASIQYNKMKLYISYSLVIIFFVSLVSVLLEVLVGHYQKSILKTQ